MKLLLHTCCGPCTIYPLRVLRDADVEVMGYFYRSNIHPYTECLRRQQTLSAFAEQTALPLIIAQDYDLENFLRTIAFREMERCRFCYHARLRSAAIVASRGRFDFFSSTLLYSKFQKHDAIREIGESVAQEVGIPFYYRDFRTGWKEGVTRSKELGMYRQQYCGCIYSERERYLAGATGGRPKTGLRRRPPVAPAEDRKSQK